MVDKTTTQVLIIVVGLGAIYWINTDSKKKKEAPQITVLPPPRPGPPPEKQTRARNIEEFSQLTEKMKDHQQIEFLEDMKVLESAVAEGRSLALKERRGRWQQWEYFCSKVDKNISWNLI